MQAIADRLKEALSLVAEGFSPSIPIAWENRDYEPSGRFFQAAIIPAPNERLTIRGHHRVAGSLSVVVATETNKGTKQGFGIADAVAAGFPCDAKLMASDGKTIRITAQPSIRPAYQDGGWWRTPVIIPFEVL